MASKTLFTLDQFEQLPPQEGKLLELNEGELYFMSPGRPRHNRVRDRLARRLTEVVEKAGLGEIFVETEFRLGSDTVRIPDAAFVPAEHVKRIDPDLPVDGAPALAIEVVSPTDLAEDLARKIDQYLAAGAEGVWVLYPKVREVHVHKSRGRSQTLGDAEVLEDHNLIPGFSVQVRELFE